MHKMDIDAKAQDKKIAETICNNLNVMYAEEAWIDGFVEGLQGEHRTLQQSAVRAILIAFQKYGKSGLESHNYDGRNEAAVEQTAKLEIGAIPFI